MGQAQPDQITLLLKQMKDGDRAARDRLVSLVYPHLKKIAVQHMRRERPDHTLQPTALVNEVFLRFAGRGDVAWQNRSHFYSLLSELMRQILVDYSRRRRAAKRGGGEGMVELEEWRARIDEHPEMVLEVDRLLTRLIALDERQAKVVEMRYFAGLTEGEIAETLGVSERTVKRDWTMARAWILKELSV
jgi:RNA polymerase sigma factor (TIGR02999 family)